MRSKRQAGALIIAAEVSMGQDLLKQRAPAKGGRKETAVKNTAVKGAPTLQEILMCSPVVGPGNSSRRWRTTARSRLVPRGVNSRTKSAGSRYLAANPKR